VSERRLVAVLGYSNGRRGELHPVCTARLAQAEQEVRPEDVVLLSGWARRSSRSAEAELMAHAWTRGVSRLLLDRSARSTYGNAVGAAAAAGELGVSEVVLVTSSWHGRRAAVLLRAALRGTGRRVTLATSAERGSVRARLRELACWSLVPVLVLLTRTR